MKLNEKSFPENFIRYSPLQFNFQVLLFVTLKSNEDSLCSGSILSQKYVLSAAHCFQNFAFADILGGVHNFELDDAEYEVDIVSSAATSASKFKFYVKVFVLFDLQGPSQVKIHEQYNNATLLNDIAIVNVAKKPIVFNTKLQPLRLAPRALVGVDLMNRIARLAGWGAYSDIGRQLLIAIIISRDIECNNFNSISNARSSIVSSAVHRQSNYQHE